MIYQSICNAMKETAYLAEVFENTNQVVDSSGPHSSVFVQSLKLDTHSFCEHTLLCSLICPSSFLSDFFLISGPDCSLKVPSAEPYWFLPNVKPDGQSLGRASHKAVVHGKLMWVIGGFTFNYSSFQMVIK